MQFLDLKSNLCTLFKSSQMCGKRSVSMFIILEDLSILKGIAGHHLYNKTPYMYCQLESTKLCLGQGQSQYYTQYVSYILLFTESSNLK